jgi:3-methylfumaryl-CoA hydratase
MSPATSELRAWIGREERAVEVEVSRRDIVKYALATEQRLDKYLRGDEAPPMFAFNLFAPLRPVRELGADGLRREAADAAPSRNWMAGGVEFVLHRPIRPGDRLRCVQRIEDVYEKAGRQGPLTFLVLALRVSDADGLAVLDERRTSIAR